MGDCFNDYKEVKEHSQEKRKKNLEYSTKLLEKKGIEFESKNKGIHLIVGEYDFWPSTGKFIHRKTKVAGRGVFNLIKKVLNE